MKNNKKTTSKISSTSKKDTAMKKQLIKNITAAINSGALSADDLSKIAADAASPKKPASRKADSKVASGTKAYSIENVRRIKNMIDAGATSQEIGTEFQICKKTIKHYLYKRHEGGHINIAKKYYEKLCDNDKKAKFSTTADVAEDSTTTSPAEPISTAPNTSLESVSNVVANLKPNTLANSQSTTDTDKESTITSRRYLLDSQLVQRHDGRAVWNNLIRKLKSEFAIFYVYSANSMRYLYQKATSIGASRLAKQILDDKSFECLDTKLYLQYAAIDINATVITNTSLSFEECKKAGADVIMVDDYLHPKLDKTFNFR